MFSQGRFARLRDVHLVGVAESAPSQNAACDLAFSAAAGEEAYTVGLVNPWDYMKYTRVAKGSTDPEIGESVVVGGGASSLTYDRESGKHRKGVR